MAAARRRRPLRALQRFRQHDDRQSHRSRAVRSPRHPAWIDQHRLPRAFARPVVLLVDGHQLREPRAGAGAGGIAHAPGPVAGRAGAGAAPLKPENSRNSAAGVVFAPVPVSRSRSTTTASPSTTGSSCRATSPRRPSRSCSRRSERTAPASSPTRSTPGREASTWRRTTSCRSVPPGTCGSAPATAIRAPHHRIGRDAASACRVRVGAVRSPRAAAHRMRPAERQPAARRRLAPWPSGRRDQRVALRGVLQLHAQCRRRPGVRREMADRRRRIVPRRRLHRGGGVQNLFDVFPDRNSTVNSFNGIQTFPSHSPFGMNGRSIYARFGRTF